MLIKIIAVGKRMPKWVVEACNDYQKRFPSTYKLKLIELNTEKRSKNNSVDNLMRKEAEQIKAQCEAGEIIIALDENGKSFSSMDLANHLEAWHNDNQTVSFIIGGPDGLDPEIKSSATLCWSLGQLVLPHPLVRIILIEQLYRGISILQNHPYHRE